MKVGWLVSYIIGKSLLYTIFTTLINQHGTKFKASNQLLSCNLNSNTHFFFSFLTKDLSTC
jgi:hypothetical protein